MKRLIKKIAYIVCISVMFFTTGCNDIFNQVTELNTSRLFRPISFAATVNKTQVTLSWVAVNNATSYTLQVSLDSLDYSKPVVDTTLTQLSYVKEFAGATTYYAKIRANAIDTTKIKNSGFNSTLSFKTQSENIFGINVPFMTAMNTIDVKWLAKANVTHLIITASDNTTSTVSITSDEAIAGEKVIAFLPNSNYTIQIYNKDIVRGKTSALVEGDYYLDSGADLPTNITNATAGQVIILAPGVNFPMGGGTYRFSKDVKVRGLSATNRPIVCMSGATPTATSSMLGFVDQSTMNYVKFENIDFTGYCDNNTAAIKIGYLFNNNLMTTVKSLSFKNCNLHNFGNTPMRLQASKGQSIDTLSFNSCVINEIGFSSTYAIVNSNSADYFKNIYFNNCTVYNFKGSLVLRTAAAPVVAIMGNLNITNCTINQSMQDPSSARYLIDANGTTFTNGINIKNCILGSSGAAIGANGMRYLTGTIVNITGTYYTTDYVDDPIPAPVTSTSIKSKMTPYSGASTSLWNNPVSGDFTLKDAAFPGKGTAGDLRWY